MKGLCNENIRDSKERYCQMTFSNLWKDIKARKRIFLSFFKEGSASKYLVNMYRRTRNLYRMCNGYIVEKSPSRIIGIMHFLYSNFTTKKDSGSGNILLFGMMLCWATTAILFWRKNNSFLRNYI